MAAIEVLKGYGETELRKIRVFIPGNGTKLITPRYGDLVGIAYA